MCDAGCGLRGIGFLGASCFGLKRCEGRDEVDD